MPHPDLSWNTTAIHRINMLEKEVSSFQLSILALDTATNKENMPIIASFPNNSFDRRSVSETGYDCSYVIALMTTFYTSRMYNYNKTHHICTIIIITSLNSRRKYSPSRETKK